MREILEEAKMKALALILVPTVFGFLGYYSFYFLGWHIVICWIAGGLLSVYSFIFNMNSKIIYSDIRGVLESVFKILAVILIAVLSMVSVYYLVSFLIAYYLEISNAGSSIFSYIISSIAGFFAVCYADDVVTKQEGALEFGKYISQVGLIIIGTILFAIIAYTIGIGYYGFSASLNYALAGLGGLVGLIVSSNIFYYSESKDYWLPEERSYSDNLIERW